MGTDFYEPPSSNHIWSSYNDFFFLHIRVSLPFRVLHLVNHIYFYFDIIYTTKSEMYTGKTE